MAVVPPLPTDDLGPGTTPPVRVAGVPDEPTAVESQRRRVHLLGQSFDRLTREQALTVIERLVTEGRGGVVAGKNVALCVDCRRDQALYGFYESCDLTTVDGRPLVYASAMLGARLPEMVGGPGLWWRVVERAAERGWSLYLLGGVSDVVTLAVTELRERFPALRIVGWHHGYVDVAADGLALLRDVGASGAQLLMVGMPTPKKEQLGDLCRDHLPGTVCILVGGVFDVFAGRKRMAPAWVSRLCLEWLYRLAQEPGRLWRRYLRTNSRFLGMIVVALALRVRRALGRSRKGARS